MHDTVSVPPFHCGYGLFQDIPQHFVDSKAGGLSCQRCNEAVALQSARIIGIRTMYGIRSMV